MKKVLLAMFMIAGMAYGEDIIRNSPSVNTFNNYKTQMKISTGTSESQIKVSTTALNSKIDNLNWYTTSTICCMFASTDTTGDLQVSTMTFPISSNYTIISWYMKCDVADTVQVSVSSGAFGSNIERICGTDYIDASTQTDSSDTALSGWGTSLGAGGWVRFVLNKASAARNITVGLIVKKWAR